MTPERLQFLVESSPTFPPEEPAPPEEAVIEEPPGRLRSEELTQDPHYDY